MTLRRITPLLLVLAVSAGCTGAKADRDGTPTSSVPATFTGKRPTSAAKLSIIEPKNGQVINGSTVHLVIGLKDAKIVPTTSQNLKPDEGHVHVILDDQLISMTFGLKQEIPNVPPGQHLLRVEFVANDHGPFDPIVFAQVAFQVMS